MAIVIGSARIDENGKATGGKAGDQKQTSNHDTTGEVSMQNMYNSSKGWYVIRPKTVDLATKLAKAMETACNNKNIGYDQSGRYGVITNGINAKTPTEADCSSLVRACCIAAGFDPKDFNTASEVSALAKTGKFEKEFKYVSQAKTPLYNGDILVTCTKGHTVIVVSGNPRQNKATVSYYNAYTGTSTSIVDALAKVGEKDTSKAHRTKIAQANGISDYTGTAYQNMTLLSLIKAGKLIKA